MRELKITKTITNRESASLDKYLQEIGKVELTTMEEEVELAQRIKKGDRAALEKLVMANLRSVKSVAMQYQLQGLSLPDLIKEGNLGLYKAAENFDETRGFKFISYAVWWVRQSILQALANVKQQNAECQDNTLHKKPADNRVLAVREIECPSDTFTNREREIVKSFKDEQKILDPNDYRTAANNKKEKEYIFGKCSICQADLFPCKYIAGYVCKDCMLDATDKDGRPLSFDIDNDDKLIMQYSDNCDAYNTCICYVRGIECRVEMEEAKVGYNVVGKREIMKPAVKPINHTDMSQKNQKPEKSTNVAQMFLNFQDTGEATFSITGYGTATIDWGDGSSGETHILSSNRDNAEVCWHVYHDKSDYTVCVIGEKITSFSCRMAELTNLDVSGNPELTELDLTNCRIIDLDVSKNMALENLYILGGECLTHLDVSNNTALKHLGCSDNGLASLDVSKNFALELLHCFANDLEQLDLSNNPQLTRLICDYNLLTRLNVSKNTALIELNCSNNDLSAEALNELFEMLPVRKKDLSKNPFELDFDEKEDELVEEAKLKIEGNPGTDACDISIAESKGWKSLSKMTMTVQGDGEFIIQMAGFDMMCINWGDGAGVTMDDLIDDFTDYSHTYKDITSCTITITGEEITHLYCGNNRLTDLDIRNNTKLIELGCYNNQITHLDVNKNTKLTKLHCWSNPLTELDISANIELKELKCDIEDLNFSKIDDEINPFMW